MPVVKNADPAAIVQDPLLRQVRELAPGLLLVGGAVRDYLRMGRLSADLDFMVLNRSSADLAKTVADTLGGHLVPLDWEFGIHRVVFDNGVSLDFSDALENNIDTDLARRDLTVNAMAVGLDDGRFYDPYNGRADLEQGVIRMISEANLLDDPLRLLRVFRFAATLNAAIDPDTLAVVKAHGPRLLEAAGERIHYELFKLFDATPCFPALNAMADSGLLEVIFPEMTAMRGIRSSGFHHLGLFDHTLELVRQAERLIDEIPPQSREWVLQPFNPTVSRFGLIKLACLMHDIAKPETMGHKTDAEGRERLTFYGHEIVGEERTNEALKRLKIGNDPRNFVKKLVRWHLYPCQFGPDSPKKSVLRFFRRMGAETQDVVLLALADRHSALGDWLSPEDLQAAHDAHLWLLAEYHRQAPVLATPLLLDGRQIMALLSLAPGPEIGQIKDALLEAQQLGEVKTPEEAAAWLREKYLST